MSDRATRLHARVLHNADTAECFSGRAQLQAMLDVEAALTAAQADAGVAPASCVAPIQAAARAELYDLDVLKAEATETGNPVIPVVRHLTARVAKSDADAARYVHWGATSQDILDTGLLLQLRAAVPGAIDHLAQGVRAAAAHAHRHRDATMAGRTWLQQATPVTFGLKAAGWADAMDRSRRRLQSALDDALVLQFGGATGTLASLGSQGLAVTERLAARLDLPVPDIPWHAHRDRFAQLASALGIAAGTCGKIGRDIALLAQTEVGEASEATAPGRGGSSTMPQKQNPVASSVALAAAGRAPGLVATLLGAMIQEHERGLGGWQVEWDTLPDLVICATSGTRAAADALDGLQVDTDRMRANAEASGGLLLAESIAMTLAKSVGKHEAHACIAAACRRAAAEGRPFADVLGDDPLVTQHLDRAEIARRLSPDNYLGATRDYIDRVLARVAASDA
ncbi:MAG: 3-carboxy-cis,cis-muconate cycloisomerase [Acidobacteria bacterium]|nr:3-carboxy-cis,cis-muconate cycloisomerase [Acidobacteriota bacterium]MYJ03439.1 3-carboxy-cis,cis-muconate cycloisomerase [Acidobacteriota bacterium]